MYCPKCGTELADTAKFCASCGNRMESRTNFAAQAPGFTASVADAVNLDKLGGFTPMGIGGRAAAAVATICLFMPWLEVPALQTISSYASSFGFHATTQSEFAMYDMGGVTDFLDMLSSSGAYGAIHGVFLLLWLVALALLVAGIVLSLTGKKQTKLLVAGGIAAAVVAALWFIAISFLDGEYSRQLAQVIGTGAQFFALPPAVLLTALCGAGAAVLTIMDKGEAK